MALSQSHFRFGIEELLELTHSWWQNEDVNHSQEITADWIFLLRFCVQADATGLTNVDNEFQYNKNGAGWVNITTSSAVVKAVASVAFTNGQNCTKRLSGTGTFESTAAGCTEDGISGGTTNDIVASGNSETEAGLQVVFANVVNGDTIQFRLTRDGGILLDSYLVTPTLTIVIAGLTAVGDIVQKIWNVRQAVPDTSQSIWNVRFALGDTVQQIWNTKSAVGDVIQHIWNVLTSLEAVGDTFQLVWHTKRALGNTSQSIWNARFALGNTIQNIWNTNALIGKTNQYIWAVLTPVADTLQSVWNVRQVVGKTRQAVWNVLENLGTVWDALQLIWYVGVRRLRLHTDITVSQELSMRGQARKTLAITTSQAKQLSLVGSITEK